MNTQPDLLAALLTIRDASPPEAGLMAGVDTWSALVEELQKIAGDAVDAAGVRPDGDGLRFYIDHGVIHDRVTGKHVVTDGEWPFEDDLHSVLAFLNSLAPVGERLMPLSDINDLDDVCRELGIQDSHTTPAQAVKELNEEIERLRATQPARDAAEGAGDENIPFAIWADRVERTTRLIKVQEADSYRSAIRMARIDCFYDFEAKRLVALLRSLAAPPKPAPDAMREDFTTKVAVTALLAARELIEANRLSADPADWFTSLRKLRDALAAPLPPADETSITINREALYRAISNHLPSDMIDAIWQEVIEALELKP